MSLEAGLHRGGGGGRPTIQRFVMPAVHTNYWRPRLEERVCRGPPKTRLGLYKQSLLIKHLTDSAHFSILVYRMNANSTMEVNLEVGDKFSDYAALLKQIDRGLCTRTINAPLVTIP